MHDSSDVHFSTSKRRQASALFFSEYLAQNCFKYHALHLGAFAKKSMEKCQNKYLLSKRFYQNVKICFTFRWPKPKLPIVHHFTSDDYKLSLFYKVRIKNRRDSAILLTQVKVSEYRKSLLNLARSSIRNHHACDGNLIPTSDEYNISRNAVQL